MHQGVQSAQGIRGKIERPKLLALPSMRPLVMPDRMAVFHSVYFHALREKVLGVPNRIVWVVGVAVVGRAVADSDPADTPERVVYELHRVISPTDRRLL